MLFSWVLREDLRLATLPFVAGPNESRSMIDDLGFSVLRQIPLEYVTGIARQIYSVHGGVIREVATGRIVAHLAIPNAVSAIAGAVPGLGLVGNLVQTYQLHALSQTVQQVLTVSLASTALAGLGLATSLVGFAFLSNKLNSLDRCIGEIKEWLGTASEGQLRAAVADLSHSARTTDLETRRQLLLSAKSTFTGLAHHYRRQAASAKGVAATEVYEDFAVTALMGAAMCASDLGLHEAAAEDFRTFREEWTVMARRRLASLLDLDNAPRLLDGRYVGSLSTSDLISILDLARNDPRGIAWIDEMRRGFSAMTVLASNLRPVPDEALVYAKKLCARNEVLAAYESHFDVLSSRRITISEFSDLTSRATADGRLAVLVPAKS